MREPLSPSPLRGPRPPRGARGLNHAAQIAAEREPLPQGSVPLDHAADSDLESDSGELVLPEDMRAMRARAAEARRVRMVPRARESQSASDTVEELIRASSPEPPAAPPAPRGGGRALPRVPHTAPRMEPAPALRAETPTLLGPRASMAQNGDENAMRRPSPSLPGGLGPVLARGRGAETDVREGRSASVDDSWRAEASTTPPGRPEPVFAAYRAGVPSAVQRAASAGGVLAVEESAAPVPPMPRAASPVRQEARASDEPARRPEERRVPADERSVPAAPQAEATSAEPEPAEHARSAAPEPAAPMRRLSEPEPAREPAPEPALSPELAAPPAPPFAAPPTQTRSEPASRADSPTQADARTQTPPVVSTPHADAPPRPETPEHQEVPGAFPAPPLVPFAVPETSTARTQQGGPNSRMTRTMLAALSTQTRIPGNPVPSIYGLFSDEPAPTSFRPAGAQRNWREEEVPTPGIGRIPPALAERVLGSGPSVSNLHPTSANLLLSPGAGARKTAAQLRKSAVQPGSVTYPAGTLSHLGDGEAPEAKLSHKFEENSIYSFSWTIDKLDQFVDEVQHGHEEHEVWSMRPLFGAERWRLELSRRHKKSEHSVSKKRPEWVLQLTCLGLMGLPFHAELPTEIMLGLRVPRMQRVPSLLSSDYLWRKFLPCTFHQKKDTLVFTAFPPLAELLADSELSERNALELVVQVACGPSVLPERGEETSGEMRMPFETPDSVQVPRSLVHSLANLIDDASTGDLMIVVREKGLQQRPTDELAQSVGLKTFVQPWPTGTPMPDQGEYEPEVFVRDRVLWAHAAVLRARSEFFATMLESSFSENLQYDAPTSGRGQSWRRPYRLLRIPDADYVTLYWFLRYLYTGEVQFRTDEDIEAVTLDDHWILGQEAASSRPEWKWKPVEALDEDESFASSPEDTSFSRHSQPPALLKSAAVNPVLSDLHSGRHVEVTTHTDTDGTVHPRAGTQTNRGRQRSASAASSTPCASDPHPHPPMLPVPPASALALYRLAHRYDLLPLCDLATAHIISQLTPQNAVNYLLCTALFEQLQYAIQQYICTSPC